MLRILPLLSSLVLLASCAPSPPGPVAPAPGTPPAVQREFRGVWVASVSNIDWPSQRGLPVAQQQAELLAILDRAAALNLNAVILQVRPGADALYDSPHEPWSEYLTGEMGRAPEPFYDPLAFAVQEAHRRGLELHAWFNPYRARHPSARSEIAPGHLSRTHPEIVHTYGRHLWMDPGEPAVQDHSVRVILDVVRRYDIDGVHIDDYFYPYRERDEAGNLIDFPDERSWTRYVQGGGRLSRDEWRRDNVDRFVERLYREIKREKYWVKFGISPFGIWRPGYPEQIQGFDAYQEIYADARKWFVNGWLDYFTPQLYWPIAQTPQSFPVLLGWWVEQNVHGRHLWPGNFTNRAGEGTWPDSEIVGQIHVTRGQQGANGNVHFSMRSLMRDTALVQLLDSLAYQRPALVPASDWLWRQSPGEPQVSIQGGAPAEGVVLSLEPRGRVLPTWWVVRARYGEEWWTEVIPGWQRSHRLAPRPGAAVPNLVAVSAVSRTGNEGPVAMAGAAVPAAVVPAPARAGAARAMPAPRVIGYLAGWGVRSKGLRIAAIPAERLTHIFYAFGDVTQDGVAALTDPCLDIGECPPGREPPTPGGNFAELLALKQRHPHLQLLISLGGWTRSKYFSDAAATPEARERLVRSTIDLFLHRFPGLFDGIDVDWEFPIAGGLPENSYRAEDRENYTALMAEYRRQLDAVGERQGRRYLLAIAAGAGPRHLENLEVRRLAEVLDWINVMTYDYHAGGAMAHFNSPLHATTDDPTPRFNIDSSMQAFLDAGVPAEKLVVGAPFYGRGYGGVANENHGLFQAGNHEQAGEWGASGIDYRVLVSRRPEEQGFQRHWHPEAQVPWLYDPQLQVWISYDDPQSIERKARYVRERGFGGIMFWELGGDDGSLLQAIQRGLGGAEP